MYEKLSSNFYDVKDLSVEEVGELIGEKLNRI